MLSKNMFISKKVLSPVFSVFMIMTLLVQQSLIVRADEQVELFEAGEISTEQIKGFEEGEETKEDIQPEIKVSEIINVVPTVQENGLATIDLQAITSNGSEYEASGTWDPAGICWNPGRGGTFQFRVHIVDETYDDALLATIDPAACNGEYQSPVSDDNDHKGGNWPGNGQPNDSFELTPGLHKICAVLLHATGNGNDVARDCTVYDVPGPQCIPDLDYTDGQAGGPDGQLTLGDAVIFTQRYMAAMANAGPYDQTVDANRNGVNDVSDYECAVTYYGGALAPICPLQCAEPVGKDVFTQAVCNSPLDYNATDGTLGADNQLTLSDAVEFTKRYEAAKGSQSGDGNYDITVDVNFDSKVTVADYFCAQPYYGNAGPYTCQLDCAKACVNPIDYNSDYEITLGDASVFTTYYESGDLRADLNQNGVIDYGDYDCSLDQIASSEYQCPIQCAPTCGDKKVQPRLGEQCDDGNANDGDGCSATCKLELECNEDLADFNDDGVITLADAVLFTPYYVNAQLEADLDANGETRLHDKLCMDSFLNQPTPLPSTVATPVGTPQQPTAPQANNQPSFGGSSVYSNPVIEKYDLQLPTIDNKPVFPGSVVALNQPTTPKVLGLSVPSQPTNKETAPKSKRPNLVVVAPAVKNDISLPEAPVTEPTQPVDSNSQDTGIIGKIVTFFSGLFN